MTLFTVFTPTYNRAHTLTRLYDSLVSQSLRDFEWLVVDDGSTDATRSLVAGLAAGAPFDVRYLWQPNGGTHVAMNTGVQAATGELFLTLDSDDWCVPQALERFAYHWRSIPARRRDGYAAVTALCQDPDGHLIGDPFPADVLDSNSLEVSYRYRVGGDKWGFTRTDVMRQFPFPTGDFTFIPSGVVWLAIAREYRTRYVNEKLKYVEYLPDGQSRGGVPFQPRGGAVFYSRLLSAGVPYLRYSPYRVAADAARYAWFSFLCGDSLRTQMAGLDGVGAKAVWALSLPVGYAKARRRRVRVPS
jgi:glycosyltransferase involved in cell wall biosynthesis